MSHPHRPALKPIQNSAGPLAGQKTPITIRPENKLADPAPSTQTCSRCKVGVAENGVLCASCIFSSVVGAQPAPPAAAIADSTRSDELSRSSQLFEEVIGHVRQLNDVVGPIRARARGKSQLKASNDDNDDAKLINKQQCASVYNKHKLTPIAS